MITMYGLCNREHEFMHAFVIPSILGSNYPLNYIPNKKELKL